MKETQDFLTTVEKLCRHHAGNNIHNIAVAGVFKPVLERLLETNGHDTLPIISQIRKEETPDGKIRKIEWTIIVSVNEIPVTFKGELFPGGYSCIRLGQKKFIETENGHRGTTFRLYNEAIGYLERTLTLKY